MSHCYALIHIPHPWILAIMDHGNPLCRTMDQNPPLCSTSLGEVDLYEIVQGSHIEIEI